MRQYGSVPPVLSTAQPPAVSATSGLGTGGGAGVQSRSQPSDGQGQFSVNIVNGSAVSVGGSVTLIFPQTPPLLFIAGSEVFGTITAPNNTGSNTTITISWTGTLAPFSRLQLNCEWASSH